MAEYFAGDDAPEYSVFVAIDLGTTYSACAFAMGKNSQEIFYASEKIPTALLLNPSKRLDSFGKDAMESYFNKEDDEAEDWYYFDRFKMKLHNDKVKDNSWVIRGEGGGGVLSSAYRNFKAFCKRSDPASAYSPLAGGMKNATALITHNLSCV